MTIRALARTLEHSIDEGAPRQRFAVHAIAILDETSPSGAAEVVGRALLDTRVRSVVILEVDRPFDAPVAVLELQHQPAALAFHCLNNAAQILRGDALDDLDTEGARELLGKATEHVGELYLELIRVQRHVAELRATHAFLQHSAAHHPVTSGGK